MKHRLLHRMGVAIMILAVLGLLILLTARSSWVQTKVATIWLTRIEAASDAELSVGKIKVRWPFGIRIENLLVKGPLSDTLFYSPWIHVSINHLNLKKRRFRIGNVLLSDPVIRIKQLPDGRMNYYSLVKVFKSGDTVGNERFDFHCDRLTLHHGKFQYRKFGALPEPHQLNTNDLFVTDIEADIAGISRTMKGWSAKIDHMSFKEQSGLILNELTSKVEQDTMTVHISRLHLQTEFSTLILPDAQWMIFKTHLKNDSDNLHLRISRGSQIDFRDITCITGQKINLPPLYLSGNYTGSIRHGVFRNGNINLEGVVSYIGSFNYRYTGDWMDSYIDMNCRQLALDLNGLQEKALNGQIPGLVSGIPASLTELGRVGFEGTLQGTPGDFTNQGIWHTTMGELHTGLRVEKDSATSHFLVKGTLESEALNPNLLSGWQLPFSRLAFTVQVDGIWDGHDHWIAGVTGDLQQFRYRGKDFHHLKINGLTGDQGFQGNLKLNDPDLQFEFSGGLDLSGTVPAVDVDLNIGYASLVNLGFVTHDTLAELQMKMQGEFKGNNLDDLSGQLWIENSKYTNSNGVLPVSDLSFSIRPEMGGRKFILNSEYVDARVIGAIYPGKLLQQLSQLSADYLPLETSENSLSSEKNLNNFSFNINLKNPAPVTRTLLPFVQTKDNTQISGQYNAENQKIYIEGSSPQFALGHTQYTNLFFQLESFKDSLTLIGQLDKLQFDLYSRYDQIKLNCHLTSG
ncbi:MAG: hypothetical protein J7L89_02735, partial [Bacteroidales bacterium]|nr:hypothetical protein [Bacteroidales bacterium]